MIRQAVLARFRELQEEANRIGNEAFGLRQEILAAHAAGETIEPGPLAPAINTYPRKSISWDKLEEVLGPVEVAKLKEQVEPTMVTTLKVESQ